MGAAPRLGSSLFDLSAVCCESGLQVALTFLNDSCASTHGNICIDTIFISPSGEWKIGGFELLSSPKDEAAVLYVCSKLHVLHLCNKLCFDPRADNGWSATQHIVTFFAGDQERRLVRAERVTIFLVDRTYLQLIVCFPDIIPQSLTPTLSGYYSTQLSTPRSHCLQRHNLHIRLPPRPPVAQSPIPCSRPSRSYLTLIRRHACRPRYSWKLGWPIRPASLQITLWSRSAWG